MADRSFDLVETLGKGRVVIAGSFRPNGTGAVDNTLNTGAGFTVARSDTGKFTVTLADAYPALVAAHADVAMVSVADLKAQFGAIDVASAKTVVINILAVATPTDIASNAANRVHFVLVLRNSSLTP